ncbi:MAG: cell division protein CrgA [Propionibacteriaceae bacterium]|nr:cell division protein CrgA [Propionibacteriaceae bacterium]
MPESRTRPAADDKRKLKRRENVERIHREKAQKGMPNERRWVAPLFVTVALIGIAWIVLWNVAGSSIPVISALGGWNMLIGMGLIAVALLLMTLWK